MVIKTKAVVLHVVKFGDNQLVVDFLTEALGRLSFMIRLPKSAKAKVKRQVIQLAISVYKFLCHQCAACIMIAVLL